MRGNGNGIAMEVPIIGAGQPVGKAKAGAQCMAIARTLDDEGTFEVNLVSGPNGERIPLSQRSDYMDAHELLEAFRLIVRQELGNLMTMVVDEVERLRKDE